MVDFSFTWLSVEPSKCPSNTSDNKQTQNIYSRHSGQVSYKTELSVRVCMCICVCVCVCVYMCVCVYLLGGPAQGRRDQG